MTYGDEHKQLTAGGYNMLKTEYNDGILVDFLNFNWNCPGWSSDIYIVRPI